MTAALMFGLALVGCGYLWLQHSKRDRVAAEVDRDESARWFELVRSQPDTTAFDPKPDVTRARLRSVATCRCNAANALAGCTHGLRLVPPLPVADDSWLEELLAEDPLQIPQQRQASE